MDPTGTSGSPSGSSKIGRISASNPGTLDEFPTENMNAGPDIITVGPDGNIWFTELTGNSIGRINPATPLMPDSFGGLGIHTSRYCRWSRWGPLDHGRGAPTEVVIVSPAGTKVGDVPLPTGFDPRNTLGPDGAVWYAEFQAKRGRARRLRGNTTNMTGMNAPAGPRYVAGGPGDSLWFTQETGNRVGRVTGIELAQTTTPPPPPSDTTRPNITRFRITRTVFRLGGRGTVIRWSQSEAARNTISFHRRVNGRWRRVPRRRMSFNSTAGNHRLRFRGRVSRRRPLRPGRYRMTMTARDAAGNVSSPDRVRFRLLPRVRR